MRYENGIKWINEATIKEKFFIVNNVNEIIGEILPYNVALEKEWPKGAKVFIKRHIILYDRK